MIDYQKKRILLGDLRLLQFLRHNLNKIMNQQWD